MNILELPPPNPDVSRARTAEALGEYSNEVPANLVTASVVMATSVLSDSILAVAEQVLYGNAVLARILVHISGIEGALRELDSDPFGGTVVVPGKRPVN